MTQPGTDDSMRARIRGEFASDWHVDMDDLLLAVNWAKSVRQPGFDGRCDVNGDGSVNVIDLLFLADDWVK
jgi:hypothetical protein